MKDVTITRVPKGLRRGSGYVLPGWVYTIASAGDFDSSSTVLSEARGIAKNRARGGKVIEAWKGK